jgi:hypothetical protein
MPVCLPGRGCRAHGDVTSHRTHTPAERRTPSWFVFLHRLLRAKHGKTRFDPVHTRILEDVFIVKSMGRSGEFLSSPLPRDARSEWLHGLSRARERKQMGAKGKRLDLGNMCMGQKDAKFVVHARASSSNRCCLSHICS